MNESTIAHAPRMLPKLTSRNRAFWTGGANDQLLIQHCAQCQRWVHPPTLTCQDCGGELVAQPVSGRGTVFSFTVNHQAFRPEVPPPYVIAIIELAEQSNLRIPANIIDCDPDQLRCGMDVRVVFEHQGEHFVPCFVPDERPQ
jgi:uncharacterized OB-fold protein